jgi:hypothetical protein
LAGAALLLGFAPAGLAFSQAGTYRVRARLAHDRIARAADAEPGGIEPPDHEHGRYDADKKAFHTVHCLSPSPS